MTYPEHVVDRVAAAMYDADQARRGPGGQTLMPVSQVYYDLARAALGAMGFREQRVPGVTRVHTRWVAMTDWEWE